MKREVAPFNVYVASAKAATKDSQSVGYCAYVKNLQTSEVHKIFKGGHTTDFGKMIVVALKAVFESGVIPPSSVATEVFATVYTSNEYVAKMFSKRLLRNFSTKNWKKKDGTEMAHRTEWEAVHRLTSHMLVNLQSRVYNRLGFR